MSSDHIVASIVIPTYNRCQSLAHTLHCLNEQTFPADNFEVIVVDDGSTDGTYSFIDALGPQMRYTLRVERRQRTGPGQARNWGLTLAKGQVVLFIDSDCEPEQTWVKSMVMATNARGAVGGRIEVPKDAGVVQKCVTYILNSWLGGMGRTWRLCGFIPGYRLRTMNAGAFRSVLEAVGGFHCTGGFYGEDTELGERLLQHGVSLYHCSDAVVLHRESRTAVDYTFEAIAKGMATVKLVRKGAIEMRGIYVLPALLILSGFGLACGFLCSKWLFSLCLASLSLYSVLLSGFGVACARKTGLASVLCVLPIVALLLHLSYGIGTLLGLAGFHDCEKGTDGPVFSCFNYRKAA